IEGETGTLWRYAEASLLVTKARRGDKQGLDQARARLTEIAAQRPNWSRVPLLEAQINELEGNTERAIEGYRQAIQLGDPGTLAARQLVLLLYRLNRIDEADRVISRLADKSPLMAGTLGQVAAELSLRNKDYERALELAQRSVRADAAEYRDRIWLALVQAASGKPDDALATLRLAVQVAGDVPDVWVALVQQMARMGLKSDAEAAIREAQAKLPPARAPLALALCYELIGSPDRAEKSYQEVLKAQPDDLALLERVTSFYIQAQRPRQAEPLLRRMLDPKLGAPATALARTRRNLAIVLADRGTQPQFQEALALIEANLQGGTKSDDDLRVRATVLASQPARRREAIQIFEEIGRRREPSPADRLLLFGLYSDTGDWDRARTLMQALVAEHGDEPIYLVSFVGRLIERGDLAEAKPLVDKLEELEPAAYRAKELRARLLKADGQADQAAALLKSAAREPGTAPPIVRIAVLLDGWGRPADAEEMYRLLVERSSQPESALLLIDFLSRTGRSDEALDLCDRLRKTSTLDVAGGAYLSALGPDVPDERAAQRAERALTELNGSHPESPMLPIHLAVLKYRQGQYEDSEAIYRRLLQRNDRHVAALNNLAWLLAQRGRGGDEPLRLIDRALEIGGKLPALLDTRGLVCLVLGRTDEAIQDLEQATAQAPDGNVYFHLARAYQQAEKRAAASDAFRKAQSLGVRPDPLERPVYDRLLALLGPK
ncbi:MAG TPA: tetratricopeptide repeat protein, partial [Isosphaeraceae bacterium]